MTKCNFAEGAAADEEIDPHNKNKVIQLFTVKKVSKISRYIKELVNLDAELKQDKKLMRKLFNDKVHYGQFMQTNVEWLLDKAP